MKVIGKKMNLSKKPLVPRKIVNVQGKLHYNESSQAWNKLKFKKELLNEFPQLKQKMSHFVYEMQYFRDPKDFEELLLRLKKGVVGLPVLMWIWEE